MERVGETETVKEREERVKEMYEGKAVQVQQSGKKKPCLHNFFNTVTDMHPSVMVKVYHSAFIKSLNTVKQHFATDVFSLMGMDLSWL